MRTIPRLLAFGLLACAASPQKLAVYDPFASTLTEVQPPTALLPLPPNPPIVTYPTFAFDSVTSPPPFPFPNGPLACPLGLTLSATLILAIGGSPDAAGNVFLPLPLNAVPVGASVHNQNLVFCPALPSGIAFSRLQTITCGGL